jgi:hypothetical protein
MDMCTYRSCSRLIAPVIAALTLVTISSALAYETRGTTRTNVSTTSVNRSASATSVNRSASASTANVNVNSANVNRNVNVNSTNVNVNRNVNVNTGCCYNNVGVGGAVAAGVVAGAVVGSAIAASALPPACSAVVVNGVTYKNCGGAWYQPQYSGSQVTYIVVNPPR